jgi:ribonucleoside-diphosphate reductase alpha chain
VQEITLPTGIDHLGNDRTAVCCLSSLNLETWDEWHGDKRFVEDVLRFLDNAAGLYRPRARRNGPRQVFGARAQRRHGRDGLPLVPAKKGIAFESAMAKAWNLKMFRTSPPRRTRPLLLAQERGAVPRCGRHGRDAAFLVQDGDRADRVDLDHLRRHQRCIEPIPANIYTHKTLSGSFVVKNPYLEKLLREKADSTNVWNSILEHGGSVQHLEFLSADEKAVYKTSFEIDQRWLLEFPPTARPISTRPSR